MAAGFGLPCRGAKTAASASAGPRRLVIRESPDLAAILTEQLEYLIRHADQEPGRYARVKAILLERFE